MSRIFPETFLWLFIDDLQVFSFPNRVFLATSFFLIFFICIFGFFKTVFIAIAHGSFQLFLFFDEVLFFELISIFDLYSWDLFVIFILIWLMVPSIVWIFMHRIFMSFYCKYSHRYWWFWQLSWFHWRYFRKN